MTQPVIPRPEHPRPQFERADWLNLNGEWEFDYDDANVGEAEQWYSDSSSRKLGRTIVVPYCYQSKLSGIGETDIHDIVWYRRTFELPQSFAGKRVLLHFGAVDYEAKAWVNGRLVAAHEGGHTPFQADITEALNASGPNRLVVRARDYSQDTTLPRGKQYWKPRSEGIFYTRTTGIWQTVWLEAVSETHVRRVRMTPDVDRSLVELKFSFAYPGTGTDAGFGDPALESLRLKTTVSFAGEVVAEDAFRIRAATETRCIGLHDNFGRGRTWSPDNPQLYDVEFVLERDEETIDRVNSYFGLRKISVDGDRVCLNNNPYYMKLVLDQGYFPDGILTPPTDEAIRFDVEATKAMGFNGARKHQKIEDPRYLYWCDKLGLLLWGEMANAYAYTEEYALRMTREWTEAIERDYNHPCVVAWVPLNESWGVPNISNDHKQQMHALALYYTTKSLDSTRLVVSNDGWEHAVTDLCTIHDYEWRRDVLADRYSSADKAAAALPANRRIFASGFRYEGQPVLVSEFGGIAFKKSSDEGWGYSGAKDEADFVKRLADVVHPLLQSPCVRGFCYTQLTDVEQEQNGLMTYDRKPKLPFDVIKQINQGKLPDYPPQ
ncbi:glycoside hydrolase family 2 protein [Paenibacillus flagellatus]|uniref:Glycoside hydrolase family 2 n=1 Tax=Paenibacillus flagellatus TaxID=2211139 RepID=A0A2V5K443_9BACL|nr:sugar-binding domain-containing protein [Paenibacillus flagellatus]PYI53968.1 glycoside hydrolase family 2 [Paenibacillus flagellatus]